MLARPLRRLLAAHPAERGRDLLFQEEARAERLANAIRLCYLLCWLAVSAALARANDPAYNLINLGGGAAWFAAALCLQAWLSRRPYHPSLKYLSTAGDMAMITVLITAYASAAGPAFALKMPITLNYFCCLGLAALRLQARLALFAVVLAAASWLGAWTWLDAVHGIEYGASEEHAASSKVHGNYLLYQLAYLAVFGLLTCAAALNVRRLADLRARESGQAARANERAVIAAGVAHEIKNPLGGIYGAAQLLREEGRGNDRFVGIILEEARRLNEFVAGFLRVSRPFPARPVRIDLAALLREFCAAESALPQHGGVECRAAVATHEVVSDPDGIRHILLNLVQNARRYQPEGRPVRLRLDVEPGAAVVGVEDDGPGVPEPERPSLFEPFHTTSPGGTGLGLALSRHIARALGGDLRYEPLPAGARFALVLPDHAGGAA